MMLPIVCMSLLLVGSQALIQCPQNVCQVVDCAPVMDCVGKVSVGGGYCGCCDICVTQVVVKRQAEMAPCLRKKMEIERSKQNDIPLIGVTEPVCDVNGYFSPVQCFGTVCYCVDKSGTELKGYTSSIGMLATMDCQCAVDQAEYTASKLVGKMFYCDANGNYKNTPTAAPMMTMTVTNPPVTGSGLLSGMLTPTSGVCAKELASSQTSDLLGTFVPECDADGNYTPRQCRGSECYCVRKDGTKIEGYSGPIETKDHITCQCARDKDTYETMGKLGRIHTCRHNGNYQQYQCIGSMCYCTDDLGARITDQSVAIADISNLKCE